MLGPFDWYSAIEIGIAAAIVGIVVLISWLQPPPRPTGQSMLSARVEELLKTLG